MSKTIQQILDDGSSSNDFVVAVAQLRDVDGNGLGKMLREIFVPTFKVRSGLDSLDTHVEELPGLITAVLDAAGAAELTILHVGAPGAGEVLITYDASGIPTLEFGDGANTGYQVLKIEAPAGIAGKLDALFR